MASKDLVFTILGIDKASPAFDRVGKSAEQAGDRLDKVGTASIKTMAGITAASVASGVAVGAAIGAVPLLFIGMAAAAVSGNKEVRDSFHNLSDNVVDDVKAMTEPLAKDFVGAANDLGKAWGRDVAPVLKTIFADPAISHGIREMSKGVGELAGNAMPGFLAAVRASPPVMTAFRTVLGDVGTGVGDFFTNISRNSDSSAQVLTGFGRIVSDVLGDVGDLIGQLTATVAPRMGQIEKLFDQTTNSVLGLAQGGLPVLSSAASGGMSVLSGVLGVLEPISSQLGTGLGLTLAAAGGWKVLTSAGNAFTSLDLGGKIERTALSAGIMTESLTGSANAGERVASAGSKIGTVLRGVGQAIPIVGAGAVLLGMAMDAAGQRMEDAANRGKVLAAALIKGGAEAETARVKLAGLSTENERLSSRVTELAALVSGPEGQGYREELGRTKKQLEENNSTLESSKSKYKELRDSLGGADLAQVKYNEAVAAHGLTSAEAAAAGAAWRAAMDEDKRKQDAAAEATKTHSDRIIEQQAIMLGAVNAEVAHQSALLGVEQAQNNLNEVLKTHAVDSLEARNATNAYEQALLGAVSAAGAKAQAEHAGSTESQIATAVTQAQAAEILNLAAAAGVNAPASLMKMVGGLSATTLAAIGVTGTVNEAGDAVYNLPGGKQVVISGDNADAKAKIDEINRLQLQAKTLYINTVTTTGSRVAEGYGDAHLARGGEVRAGEPLTVGEEGRERFVPLVPGTIVPHNATVHGDRASRLGAGGAGVTKNYYLTLQNVGNSQIDVAAQFRRMELLDDPEGLT